jgi:hypothetical protein
MSGDSKPAHGLISAQPNLDRCELDEGVVVSVKFVISGCDAPGLFNFIEEPFDKVEGPSLLCGHHQDPMPRSGIGLKQTWPNRAATSQTDPKRTSNPSRTLQALTDQTHVDGDARSNCPASFCKASPMTAGWTYVPRRRNGTGSRAAARFLIPARSGSSLCRRCPRRITVASTGSPSGCSFLKRHDIACEHSYFVRAP